MARKRGGIAGFYDRNKGVLQTLAPIAAGAIGGPLAGAAVGAAMRGLDRPGKSGIGFDVSEGLQGGVSGYMGGRTGQALRSGVEGLLTARKLDSLAPVDMTSKVGMTPSQPFFSDRAAAFALGDQVMPVDATNLAASASPFANVMPRGAATARANMAREAARAVPSSSAVSMPSSPAMSNMFPNMGDVGQRTFTQANPAAQLANQPNQPLSRFTGIGVGFPGDTTAAFSVPTPPPVPTPAPTPTPAATPWWRTKEGMSAIGQGAQAVTGLISSQSQLAMEREKMEREQREAEARAELMALFAPRMLAGFPGMGAR